MVNDPFTSKGLGHGVEVLREDGTFQRRGLVGSLLVTESLPLKSTVGPSSRPSFYILGNEVSASACPLLCHHDALSVPEQ